MSKKNKRTILLEHYLKKLRLPAMVREYASLAAVCRNDRSDYSTYLLRLTERELIDRERKAAERRVKEARFPIVKTLDTFDFRAQPSINESLVRELMRGEYLYKCWCCINSRVHLLPISFQLWKACTLYVFGSMHGS